MLTGLLHTHNLLRYLILLLILISIVKSFSGWFGKKQYLPGDKKIALFTLISAHLQLVLGLTLYFMKGWHTQLGNMENPARFWSLEHLSMMIVAIALITIGYSSSKKAATDEAKHKRVAIFYLLALIVIFLAIPWPWSAPEIARGWVPGMQ